MKVKVMESRPIRRRDGTWTTVIREFEEDVPDKGRHTLICNKCPDNLYPQCRGWCPMEKSVK